MSAAHLCCVAPPESAERKQPEFSAKKQPAVAPRGDRGFVLFEVLNGLRELSGEIFRDEPAGACGEKEQGAEKSHWS